MPASTTKAVVRKRTVAHDPARTRNMQNSGNDERDRQDRHQTDFDRDGDAIQEQRFERFPAPPCR